MVQRAAGRGGGGDDGGKGRGIFVLAAFWMVAAPSRCYGIAQLPGFIGTPPNSSNYRSRLDAVDLPWVQIQLDGAAVHTPACPVRQTASFKDMIRSDRLPVVVVIPAVLGHVQYGPRICSSLFVHQSDPPDIALIVRDKLPAAARAQILPVVGNVSTSHQRAQIKAAYANCTGVAYASSSPILDFQARNFGYRQAEVVFRASMEGGDKMLSPLITFLDADDLAMPDMFAFIRFFSSKLSNGQKGALPSLLAHQWVDVSQCPANGLPRTDSLCSNVLATMTAFIEPSLPGYYPKFAMSHVTVPSIRRGAVAFRPILGEDHRFVRDSLQRVKSDVTRGLYINAPLSRKCRSGSVHRKRKYITVVNEMNRLVEALYSDVPTEVRALRLQQFNLSAVDLPSVQAVELVLEYFTHQYSIMSRSVQASIAAHFTEELERRSSALLIRLFGCTSKHDCVTMRKPYARTIINDYFDAALERARTQTSSAHAAPR